MNDYDVIVIGAGPGGYPAAIRSAQLGKKTAVIEKEAYGGTCLNWGCIPTKTLIASAERYLQTKESEKLGVSSGRVSFDYAAMIKRKGEIVRKLTGGVQMLLKSNGVDMINGTARFEGPSRLSVQQPDGTTRWLSASSVIIASGSSSAMPGFLPKSKLVMESRAFLDLKELPKRLLVLGGGVIGCEFACMAAALGTEVTIVEMLDDILTVLDRDVRRILQKRMNDIGIKIMTGAPLSDIKADKSGVSGMVNGKKVSADAMLVSIGRVPNTAELELERAGVKVEKNGTIQVNSQCRTNTASIYAVGDVVAGSIQLAHAATQQGITAAEAVAGIKSKIEKVCPSCIFTMPEVGLAGISEEQAGTEGIEVQTGIFPFAALGKAMAAAETDGFVKWIADAATGQLLGAQAVGLHATDLISEAAVAIRNELTIDEIGNTIHCHPTMSEAWMEAAHAWHGRSIHMPKR
ncbi:MAG: dihydrolipoyl dehydrogenase [Kiritimatiellia bacterium]